MFTISTRIPIEKKVLTISERTFNQEKLFYFCGLPIYIQDKKVYKVEKNIGSFRTSDNSINSETSLIKLPTYEMEGILDYVSFNSYMETHIVACLFTSITTNLLYANMFSSGMYNTPLYYPMWDLLANLSVFLNSNQKSAELTSNYFTTFMTTYTKRVLDSLKGINSSDYSFFPELVGQYGEQLLAWVSNTILWVANIGFDTNPQVTPIMQQALLDTIVKVTQTRRGRLWCILPKSGFLMGDVSSISFSEIKNNTANPITVKIQFTQVLNNTYKG